MKREIEIEKIFKAEGTFQSMYAAWKWLHENGFDYGLNDAHLPTPITKGGYYTENNLPHKWHNFSEADKLSVAGIMTGDMRNGPVLVQIYKPINNQNDGI